MVLGISPSAWVSTLIDKGNKLWWGIDIEQLTQTLGLSRERLDELFKQYKVYFSSKSFTKDEFKTYYLKLNKNDDLQLDEFCSKVFQKYADENGRITFEKFARMLDVQLSGNAMDQLTLFFDITDQDSDGKISDKELTDMLKAVYSRQGRSDPRKLAEELASRLLKGNDDAKKKQLSLAELLHATHNQDTFSKIYEIFHPKFNPKKPRKEGEPPLHWMMRMEQYDICLNLLLNMQSDPNWKDNDGNTALHIAAQTGEKDYVEMLIAFGADVNLENNQKFTARHLAATSNHSNRNEINTLLCSVGANQCSSDTVGCTDNCWAQYIPDLYKRSWISRDDIAEEDPDDKFKIEFENDFETVFSDISANETEFYRDDIDGTEKEEEKIGDMVLCLDGGGIRGLVLIHILLEIEKNLTKELGTKVQIRDCFDWIAGTSTGGILALAIASGMSTRNCRRLYFQLKDMVFESGNEDKQTEQLKSLLQKTFGHQTKLIENETAEIKPKVLLTSVQMSEVKTQPAVLHLIRNYLATSPHLPGNKTNKNDVPDGKKKVFEHVWEAAQATSAAPTYFKRVKDVFLDGGLMANNPTLEVLTEIMEYREQIEKTAFKTEGTIVSRSRAWCKSIGIPYFRVNPPFEKDIDLAERENRKLIEMLWLTAAYLHKYEDKVKEVAQLLSKRIKQRPAA